MRLELAQQLVRARVLGHLCEGCGQYKDLQVHHRLARGSGGVSRAGADLVNDPTNMLALCGQPCHAATEHADTWQACIAKGWRVKRGTDPRDVPALIHTVNGYGWYQLDSNGGYHWQDKPLEFRITVEASSVTEGQGAGADPGEHAGDGLADEGWARS